MIQNADAQLRKLRADPRIENGNLMRNPNGTEEAWITLRVDFDPDKMRRLAEKRGYQLVRFGSLPSAMPRIFSEMLWSGTAYVLVKELRFMDRLRALLGVEPPGVAKVSRQLRVPYYDFITSTQEGLDVLYDYLSG